MIRRRGLGELKLLVVLQQRSGQMRLKATFGQHPGQHSTRINGDRARSTREGQGDGERRDAKCKDKIIAGFWRSLPNFVSHSSVDALGGRHPAT